MVKAFEKIRHYQMAVGTMGAAAFVAARLLGRKPLFKTRIPGVKHPVWVRLGTTDASVLRQVLMERHYEFPLMPHPRVIVDAGANIGLSAVFFANKYPGAVIIAIEPEDSNFEMLQRNAQPYSQIKPMKAALWNEDKLISLVDPGQGAHGFQTVGENAGQCPLLGLTQAMKLETLMKDRGFDRIDILKIDIEGAEKEVFEDSANWISHVGVVLAELHDDLKPGCGRAFAEATAGFAVGTSRGETEMRWSRSLCGEAGMKPL